MKRNQIILTALLIIATGMVLLGCATNPETNPVLSVTIPELFSPDPDIENDTLKVGITVNHPARIKEWTIQVQPNRAGTQRAAGTAATPRERPAGEARQAPAEGQAAADGQPARQRQPRGPFFEETGTGTPPKVWEWTGKSSRPNGEMVQSATDYRFTLKVTDVYDNSAEYEGIINVDVLVRRDGNNLRMVVPSIVFPPNSGDFTLLGDDDRRANARVLRLVGNALNKYPNYAVTVEGHSNPTTEPGTAARTNEETRELKPLSETRAKAVSAYLVANHNVEASRLTSVGIGGERTVADYDDTEDNWKNRRVEFILHR